MACSPDKGYATRSSFTSDKSDGERGGIHKLLMEHSGCRTSYPVYSMFVPAEDTEGIGRGWGTEGKWSCNIDTDPNWILN